MNISQAETISINELLAYYWHIPIARTHKWGVEIRYHSPLRNDDHTPSFDVNSEKNVFYDLWLSCWGGIIQLAQHMFNTDVSGALKAIEATGLYKQSQFPMSAWEAYSVPCFEAASGTDIAKQKESKGKAHIKKVKELSNTVLLSYLEDRQINPDIAKKYLKEIYYTRDTLPDVNLFTMGMENDSGAGFAVNNSKFKGFVGDTKDITSVNIQDGAKLAVFEWWPDFLAYLSHYNLYDFQSGALILNSTALKNRAIQKIREHTLSGIYLFLDNDTAWKATASSLIAELSDDYVVKDKSGMYKDCKDFNDWVIAQA